MVESAAIRVEARRDDSEKLALLLPRSDAPIAPTHWSFGQLARLVGSPATYLRQLPRRDRAEFLRKRGFSKAETPKIIETVLTEERRKPESVFDFLQGITAIARRKTHQDARLDLESRTKKLFDRAA